MSDSWHSLLATREGRHLEHSVLKKYLARQRWFASKNAAIDSVALNPLASVSGADVDHMLSTVTVKTADGAQQGLFLALHACAGRRGRARRCGRSRSPRCGAARTWARCSTRRTTRASCAPSSSTSAAAARCRCAAESCASSRERRCRRPPRKKRSGSSAPSRATPRPPSATACCSSSTAASRPAAIPRSRWAAILTRDRRLRAYAALHGARRVRGRRWAHACARRGVRVRQQSGRRLAGGHRRPGPHARGPRPQSDRKRAAASSPSPSTSARSSAGARPTCTARLPSRPTTRTSLPSRSRGDDIGRWVEETRAEAELAFAALRNADDECARRRRCPVRRSAALACRHDRRHARSPGASCRRRATRRASMATITSARSSSSRTI